MSKQITGQVEIELDWDSITGPDASEVGWVPEIERQYIAETRAALEPDHAAVAAAASRRRAIRAMAESTIGADATYGTVKVLNMAHRRRTALAIIGHGVARIDSIEKTETLVHGNDVDTVTRVAYPLLRVDNVDTVTVWPVRLTVAAMGKLDRAVIGAFKAAELLATFPTCQTVQLAFNRAMEHADKVARSHGSKCVEWDGSSADMLRILLEHANGRTRVLADRSREELVMRRAHKANQAVAKQATDDRATDLLVLLGSLHVTDDGIYSALIPDGDTTYALAILDGKAIGEFLERTLSATERKIIQRRREAIATGKTAPKRGESAAMSKLAEDIRRRASRSR